METWKPIIGFESSYEVSDFGQVRRISPRCVMHRKLTQDHVSEILKLKEYGISQQEIGIKFDISPTVIGRIFKGISYQDPKPANLKQALRTDGYLFVTLCVNAKTKHTVVHRAVAAAFIGPCPDGHQVNHKDGCKTNNFLGNLEYVTPSGNMIHSVDILGHSHKINYETACLIRELRNQGVPQKIIAAQFGISVVLVAKIRSGKVWKR